MNQISHTSISISKYFPGEKPRTPAYRDREEKEGMRGD